MVPGKSIAVAPGAGMRAFHDIHARTVVLQKIEVHSREVAQFETQISDRGNSLQEHLRHHDSGPRVDINAAVIQFGNEAAKQTKVDVGCAAQDFRIHSRMRMRRVGPYSDVDRNRYTLPPRLQENAVVSMLRGCEIVQRAPESFTRAGVDVKALANQLQDEGARSFVKSWNELMGVIGSKSESLKKAG